MFEDIHEGHSQGGTMNIVLDRLPWSHLSIGLMMVMLSGCYLYNQSRDKQGQAATKAASDVKLVDTVTAVQKRFDGVLDLEIDATRVSL
ncbi:hypothetical protein W02_40700 [Nitrospira sp. KM1]|uniref:hypothetical protein n=1 Tax=Nitrospira sp. KM1 TaxID=1936990 RepID=UPI0013A7972A|nr:hypothetical protein [Nitrospira sp. KM1]BCA56930.1 hypothetical protein W02_40700 [Nitrospira sp. KM1]